MAYDPDYDSYDPYLSRPMSRAMSRQPSIGYQGTPYPHAIYGEGLPPSDYQPQYHYTHPGSAIVPVSRRLTGAGFDNYQDQYYDGQMALGRARSRRHSTVSFANWPTVGGLPGGYPGAINIKFKRKGSFVGSGIGLDEAQQRVKLSNNDTYSFHDMHADSRRRIYLKIKWTGYSSLTYEIPLAGYDRVDLQTLARRISRACVHYLQANVIPVPWDRVILHHLEEVSYGVWQPMLSMR